MAATDPRQLTAVTSAAAAPASGVLASPAGRRAVLAATVVGGVAAAALLGRPNPAITADPELAFVLRGMAMIKLAIAALAIALVWWRAAAPAAASRFLAYTACTALLAAAATLVLELAVIAATSVVFHATLITLGLLALNDTAIAKGALGRR